MHYNDFLTTLKTCPFCELSQRILLENNSAYLTYSLAPYHPDHLLVVPKRHVEHILDLTDDEIKDIDALEKKGLEILKKLGYINMCLLVKEEDSKEKSIAHTHYHVIPDVILESSDHQGMERKILNEEEVEALVTKIKGAI